MTIALDSHAGKLALPSGAPRHWVTLAPVALLLAGMAGFTWHEVRDNADAAIATHTVAAPATLPVSAHGDAGARPTSLPLLAAATADTAPTSSARPTPAPAAAPSDDATPSLEDQELAAYHTSGD